MGSTNLNHQIDAFVRASRALNGTTVVERPQWNTEASLDAIRHFCSGIGDDNPRWTRHGQAPPMFLSSVRYPMVHGAPVPAPLTSLMGELRFTWHRPIPVGAAIEATAVQTGVAESTDRHGRRLVLVESEVSYAEADGRPLAVARGVMVRIGRDEAHQLVERQPVPYQPEVARRLQEEILAHRRRGPTLFGADELTVGRELPTLVVGPLTIGDLICWQAAIGPSYRAGPLALRDALRDPHATVENPAIGWPVQSSQQHEDVNLTHQRGMPAPFDNGVMRMAHLSRMFTDWMGDHGELIQLELSMTGPVLYGDVSRYRGRIADHLRDGSDHLVSVRITGTNQLDEVHSSGQAQLRIRAAGVRPSATGRPGRAHRRALAAPGPVVAAGNPPGVAERVVGWADTDPERVAVVASGGDLTYGELVSRAGAVAATLADHGVGPGSVVGIALPRDHVLPVAALAVLLRGAAYCPLDRSLPRARLDRLMASASPSVLIGDPVDREGVAISTPGIPVISIAEDAGAAEPVAPVDPGDAMAYLIQTSGSSGSPKAVAVQHRALARYVAALEQSLDVGPEDHYLHTASLSFSAASRQTWFPLSVGARVIMAGDLQVQDPLELFSLMDRAQVSVWDTVPTFWARCVSVLDRLDEARRRAAGGDRLRLIMTTGEPLPWSTPHRWRELTGRSCAVVNLYSQTETAGTACTFRLPSDHRETSGTVPLGRPMPDVAIHVLGDDLDPVAPGDTGEICVESHRLSIGYVGDPHGTAERFLRDDAGDRVMYRTGDLGRVREDGIVEITGRGDSRVKIRGFRVDVIEVEATLARHPLVARAAVVPRSSAHGEDTLVGFVELSSDTEPSSLDLQRHVQAELPDYAVPSIFELVEELPVTISGKLDRPRLQRLAGRRVTTGTPHRAPRSETERTLARLFAEVLDLPSVGVDDDFVALGGHSLLAIELVSRIQEATGAQLQLGDVFEQASVAALAPLVDDLVQGPQQGPPEVHRLPRDGPLPASSIQESLWTLAMLNPVGDISYNMSWTVSLEGPIDAEAMSCAVTALGRRHEALRTTFTLTEGTLHQVIAPEPPHLFDLFDLGSLPDPARRDEALRIIEARSRHHYDLGQGPLVQFALITEGDDRHLLVVTAHHIVSDMLSMAQLIRDLGMLYRDASGGGDHGLAPLPVQYADVAAWERALSQADWFADHVEERASQLAGAPTLELRTDRPRSTRRSHDGIVVSSTVPADITSALRRLGQHHRATMFMTCLAVFGSLLAVHSDQDDLIVGCAVAGRARREFNDLVGPLVNTVPIRLTVHESHATMIEATREAAATAFRYSDVPFAELVAELNPERIPGRQPVVDAYFQFQTNPLDGVTFGDLSVDRLPVGLASVAFDIELSITEVAGELRVSLGVDGDLFRPSTADALLAHYVGALAAWADRGPGS